MLGFLLDPLFIELVPITEALAARSADVAIRGSLRGCDSVYVALAEQLAQPLVTFDREQATRGGTVVRVLAPGEVP